MKDRAYIVIVDWPAGVDGDACVAAFQAAAGCDLYTARAMVRRRTPCITVRVEPGPPAAKVVDALLDAGVSALSLTWADVAGRMEPVCLRAMDPAEGAPEPMYIATPWQGEPMGVRASEVRLVVRAKVRISKKRGMPEQGIGDWAKAKVEPMFALPVPQDPVRPQIDLKTVEMVDLHLVDGRQLRCDGSRFSFQSMGDALGYSDTENMDKLAVRLMREAPAAMVDTDFAEARYLTEVLGDFMTARGSLRGGDRHGMVAFSIYSAMLAAVDRWEQAAGRRGTRRQSS